MSMLGNVMRIIAAARPVLSNNCKLEFCRSYAKKLGVGKVGAQAAQKTRLEVETNPEQLLSHCCGANIYVEGTDPELKPDSEYPEWLWNLSVYRDPQELSELDTDDPYYWKRVHRLVRARERRIRKRLDKLNEIQSPLNKNT